MQFDIVIVGAGISGATLAERYARVLNKKVLVIEKRDHIGGNCYDYYNKEGIRISKYGAHLFHTNYEEVWKYVTRFSSWYPYEHRVIAFVDNMFVPVPVNITTVNKLLGLSLHTQQEMQAWLAQNQTHFNHPVNNGEEAALARVGLALYEKIFKNYTKKQWDKYPAELDAEVLNRIPVRDTFDDRYFSDKYQYLPTYGYTPLFENMLNHPNITVKLNTDFFAVKDSLKNYEKLFYTGPIDRFFGYKYSGIQPLEYRSLEFIEETYDKEYFQPGAVVNYPNDYTYTRIVEYKHITLQKNPKTTIVKEYSKAAGEPYYPVPNPQNRAVYQQYQQEAQLLEKDGIYFVGRLANYKYFNMDEAFNNALTLFTRLTGQRVFD